MDALLSGQISWLGSLVAISQSLEPEEAEQQFAETRHPNPRWSKMLKERRLVESLLAVGVGWDEHDTQTSWHDE